MNVNAKIGVRTHRGLQDVPVSEATPQDYKEAVNLSVFCNDRAEAEATAHALKDIVEETAGVTFEGGITPLHRKQSGEFIGVSLRRRPATTKDDVIAQARKALGA